jgi:hypothetical protein
MLVNNIGDLTNKNEIQILIKNLPVDDINHIRNCVNEPPFGVETEIEVFCPNCYSEFKQELPSDQNFFFPKKKKQNSQA